MFFEFSQNNTGGRFVRNRMLDDKVIIEATTKEEAISRAESIGIYFNGCNDGRDCPCCGDRWYEPWGDDGKAKPEVYGEAITDLSTKREPTKRSVVIHYGDGSVRYGKRRPGKYGPELALGEDYQDAAPAKITVERQNKAEAMARALAPLTKARQATLKRKVK